MSNPKHTLNGKHLIIMKPLTVVTFKFALLGHSELYEPKWVSFPHKL